MGPTSIGMHTHMMAHTDPVRVLELSMSCNDILLNEAHLSSSRKFLWLLLYSSSRKWNFGDMKGRGAELASAKLVGRGPGRTQVQGRQS